MPPEWFYLETASRLQMFFKKNVLNISQYSQVLSCEYFIEHLQWLLLFYLNQIFQYWLTYYMRLVSFYTHWKHQRTRGFRMFQKGIERDIVMNRVDSNSCPAL